VCTDHIGIGQLDDYGYPETSETTLQLKIWLNANTSIKEVPDPDPIVIIGPILILVSCYGVPFQRFWYPAKVQF
jgi:hypothetical protein